MFDAILTDRISRYLKQSTSLGRLELLVLLTSSDELRSQADIAKLLRMHPNVMSQVVRRLENLHYGQRERDPKDHRRLLFGPTPEGQKLVKQMRRNRAQLERLFLHPLSDEEIEQLRAILTKIVEGEAAANAMSELEDFGSRLSGSQKLHSQPRAASAAD